MLSTIQKKTHKIQHKNDKKTKTNNEINYMSIKCYSVHTLKIMDTISDRKWEMAFTSTSVCS